MMKALIEKFKMLTPAKKACFIIEAVLGLLTIVVGVLFIVRVQWLFATYRGTMDDHPYTPETIWAAFSPIMAIVILWGILLVTAGVLSYVFPHEERRWRYKGAKADNIRELEAKLPKEPVVGMEIEYSLIKKYKTRRLIGFIVSLVITAACAGLSYGYLLNKNNFVETATIPLMQEMAKCMEHVLPFVVISFATAVIVFALNELWAKLEYESLKAVLKASQNDLRPLPRRKLNDISVWIIRGVILVMAITFIVAGILNGGAAEALKKAVAICKECIGIG